MILCVCDRYLLMLLMQGKKEKADEALMQFRFPRRTIAHGAGCRLLSVGK